jgi:hypothetical protein
MFANVRLFAKNVRHGSFLSLGNGRPRVPGDRARFFPLAKLSNSREFAQATLIANVAGRHVIVAVSIVYAHSVAPLPTFR